MSHAIFGTRPSLVWTLSKPHPHVWLRCPDTEDRLNCWALPRWDRGPWSPGSSYLLLLPPPQRPTAHSPRTPSTLRLGLSTQGFAPPRSLFVPSQWIGLLPWGPEAPGFPGWQHFALRSACHFALGLPPPQTRSCQQLCNFPQPTSGPARAAPSSWMLPGGPEPWPRPQISSRCLGLSPSLMVHTPFVPEFPQKVASTPCPLPRARLQNAETMERRRQISSRPAAKRPTASACASGDRRWQPRPQRTRAGRGLGGGRGVGAQT